MMAGRSPATRSSARRQQIEPPFPPSSKSAEVESAAVESTRMHPLASKTPLEQLFAQPLGNAAKDQQQDIIPSASASKIDLVLKPQANVSSFLVKLYNIVSDRNSNHLIHWSDDGTSFLVLDPETLTHEIIPRFFKHSNYSSFVRQLNMYGFRKVTHVLQGALHQEEPEVTEFRNEYFHRDHPEWLEYVKRKVPASRKPGGGAGNQAAADLEESGESTESLPLALGGLSTVATADASSGGNNHPAVSTGPRSSGAMELSKKNNRNFDLILQELTKIKDTQQSIQQELRQIQRENDLIWRESREQRVKHESQQAVINKILRFLASVFTVDNNTLAGSNINIPPLTASPGAGRPAAARRVPVRRAPLLLGDTTDATTAAVASSPFLLSNSSTTEETPLSVATLHEQPYHSSDSNLTISAAEQVQQQLLDFLARHPHLKGGNTTGTTSSGVPTIGQIAANPLFASGNTSPLPLEPFPLPPSTSTSSLINNNSRTDIGSRLSHDIASLDQSIQNVTNNIGLTAEDMAQLDDLDPAFISEFLNLPADTSAVTVPATTTATTTFAIPPQESEDLLLEPLEPSLAPSIHNMEEPEHAKRAFTELFDGSAVEEDGLYNEVDPADAVLPPLSPPLPRTTTTTTGASGVSPAKKKRVA